MLPTNAIEKVKGVSIVGYLLSEGIKPVKAVGHQLLYYSPFKEENTPSFYVHPDRNVFKDFSTGDKGGDIITLVSRLKNCGFRQAVRILEAYDGQSPSFSFSGLKPQSTNTPPIAIQKVKPLENKALIDYLEIKRGIPYSVASKYVQECYFILRDKRQFAVCFQNDLQGLELRSQYLKLSTAPKGITTIKGQHSLSVLVFEGFMDFLSYVVWQGTPVCDVIVLNSTVNLNANLGVLKSYQVVSAYFDNDDAGWDGLAALRATGAKVSDCRGLYKPCKDVNEYLIKHVL